MAALCRSPPETLEGKWCALASMPTSRRMDAAASLASAFVRPAIRRGMETFSRIVNSSIR